MSMADSALAFVTAHPWQMWAALSIILFTVIAFSLDRFSLEMVSLGSLVALLVLFAFAPLRGATTGETLTPEVLLRGFASPALFAIMGLLVIGQAMFQSGAFEHPTKQLLSFQEKQPLLTTVAVFLIVMIVSAFLNNTPVVVMFIPIIAAMAAQAKIAPSRVMIPLSFVSIFGGMTTIIGSSTNLLAAQSYRSTVPGGEIGFFELTPMGLFLAGVGVLFLATYGRRVLPHHAAPGGDQMADREGKQFIAQIEIGRGNPLIGVGPVAGLFPDLPDVTVRMVQRREEAILPPFEDFRFKLGDVVIIAATRAALTNLLKTKPEVLEGVIAETSLGDEDAPGQRAQLNIVEAIIAPGSRMTGQTIGQIGFHYQTNCVILGVERRSRMLRTQMNRIRLETGDVLLILGDINDLRALRADRDIVLMERSMEGLPHGRNARLSMLVFLLVIAATATGVLPIAVAATAGAAGIIGLGCLNIRQAARTIDRRIYLLIGASLAMGVALQETGGAKLIGDLFASAAAPFGPAVLMSAFFILCAAITNVLSNNATVVLFTPIAVNAAETAGIDPHILVLTIIYAANCSFATPIAYQTNLLVMTPGHYKFSDFVRVGVPLIIVIWIAYTIAAPIYFAAAGLL